MPAGRPSSAPWAATTPCWSYRVTRPAARRWPRRCCAWPSAAPPPGAGHDGGRLARLPPRPAARPADAPQTTPGCPEEEPEVTDKVVLAYSGGLDTSVAIGWIAEATGAEVVALAIDVGQGGEDLDTIRQRALACGAAH